MAMSPRAAPVSIHVGRCGAHETSLGMSGTMEGPKRGRVPSAFFRQHLSRLSAPRLTIPASPDAPSREPSPRRTAAGTPPASSRSQASQDRASGLRGGGIRRACGRHCRRRMVGRSLMGYPQKRGFARIRLETAGQPLAISPRAAPVSTHVGGCGAHETSLGMSGTMEGPKRGRGPSAFFSETPFPPERPATHHSGFTRCAIPRTVPARETRRERPRPPRGVRPRKIAHRVFVEAGSGALPAGIAAAGWWGGA